MTSIGCYTPWFSSSFLRRLDGVMNPTRDATIRINPMYFSSAFARPLRTRFWSAATITLCHRCEKCKVLVWFRWVFFLLFSRRSTAWTPMSALFLLLVNWISSRPLLYRFQSLAIRSFLSWSNDTYICCRRRRSNFLLHTVSHRLTTHRIRPVPSRPFPNVPCGPISSRSVVPSAISTRSFDTPYLAALSWFVSTPSFNFPGPALLPFPFVSLIYRCSAPQQITH